MEAELRKIGLTKGESSVYLALLTLGQSTVGPIAKKSGVSYSKIYEVLNRLLEKGMVSFIVKEKTKHYQASEPNRLKDYLEAKKKEIEENDEILNRLVPRLELMTNKSQKHTAEIFVGINGLKTSYEALLNDHSQKEPLRYLYVHNEKYSEITNEFYKKQFDTFKKLGLKLKGVSTINLKSSEHFNHPPKFVDLRFVNFPLPCTIDLYKDKVLFTTWKEKPYAYLITSKEIYDNYSEYFETIWRIAKK